MAQRSVKKMLQKQAKLTGRPATAKGTHGKALGSTNARPKIGQVTRGSGVKGKPIGGAKNSTPLKGAKPSFRQTSPTRASGVVKTPKSPAKPRFTQTSPKSTGGVVKSPVSKVRSGLKKKFKTRQRSVVAGRSKR